MRITNVYSFEHLKESVKMIDDHGVKAPIEISANILKILIDKIGELESKIKED